MTGRTFAVGDIHGELDQLRTLLGKLPLVTEDDTVVFLGDYVDRGPRSREVLSVVRALDRDVGCKVVCLRGNHEDAWLRVREKGWPEFVFPPGNGCLATLRSYRPSESKGEMPSPDEIDAFFQGSFFPAEDVAWMESLPFWYEDEHGIYVHAGLTEDKKTKTFVHPRDAEPRTALLWTRTQRFFSDYRGKRVVVGHTATELLPQELSQYTPEDPTDLWAGECVVAVDTGCGSGGFLTAVELPSLAVYESR